MARLAAQFIRTGPTYESYWASSIPIVKVLDPPLHEPFPGKEKLCRIVVQDEGRYVNAGAAGAEQWWRDFGPYVRARPWAKRWENRNETAGKDPASLRAQAAYDLRWMELAVQNGVRGTVGNFSQGRPEPLDAAYFVGVAEFAARHGFRLGFHEYWWPTIGNPAQRTWHYLRFWRFMDTLSDLGIKYLPFVDITEFGADAGVVGGGQKGWRTAGISEEKFIGDCLTYADEVSAYGYVADLYLFAMDAYGGSPWKTFEGTPGLISAFAGWNHVNGTVPVQLPFAEEEKVIVSPPIKLEPKVMEVRRALSVPEFAAWLASRPKPKTPVKEIWLHHTATDPVPWSYQTILNVKAYYESLPWTDSQGRKRKGWTAGPHLFIGAEGIWPFNPLDEAGVHAQGHNTIDTRGVEMIGFFDEVPPSAKTWENTIAALNLLFDHYGLPVNDKTLRFHREDSPKTCPGKKVVKADVLAAIAALQQRMDAPARCPLPSDVTSNDPKVLVDKWRWFDEEATRALERGDVAYALAIHKDLADLNGIAYRLERIIKAGR